MHQNIRTIITIVLLVGSVAIIVSTLVLVVKEKRRTRVIQDEIHALEEEKKKYEHQNAELKDRIAYLQSEHSYEKEAKKLNYKNPGERVVVVRRSGGGESEVNGDDIDVPVAGNAPKSHYVVWYEYFFK